MPHKLLSLTQESFPSTTPFQINKNSEQFDNLVRWVPLQDSFHEMIRGGYVNGGATIPEMMRFSGSGRLAPRFDASVSEYLFYDYNDTERFVSLPFTVSCWGALYGNTGTYYEQTLGGVNDRSLSKNFCLVQMYGSPNNVNGFSARHDQAGSQGTAQWLTGANIPFFTPYHVVGVFRSLTYRSLYVNGIYRAENTTSIATEDTWDRLGIGTKGDVTPANPFEGWIWDFRVYAGELSAGEIYRLYDPATRYDLYQPIDSSRFWSIPTEAPAVDKLSRYPRIISTQQPIHIRQL